MSYKVARFLVVCLNYGYSEAVDREKADSCLSVLDEVSMNEMRRVTERIIAYNIEHPDDQIVISWGMIENNDGRAVLNNTQLKETKMLIDHISFENEFTPTEEYDVGVLRKNGSSMQVMGLYDDLSISVKCVDAVLPASGVGYIIDYRSEEECPAEEMIERIGSTPYGILPALSDPEHANVRRRGFDANAYYEEDLQK